MTISSRGSGISLVIAAPPRVGIAVDSYRRVLPGSFADRGLRLDELVVLCEPSFDGLDLAKLAPAATDLLVLNTDVQTNAWTGLERLRQITKLGRLRPGVDPQDVALRGIRYVRLADPSYVSVAEHALMMMLACGRQLTATLVGPQDRDHDLVEPMRTDQNNRRTNWRHIDGAAMRLLSGSRLGIIGLGEIGFELASRAVALGMEVAYHNRGRVRADVEAELKLTRLPMSTLMETSDFVVIATTVVDGAPPVVAAADLAAARPGATIINVARGAALDEQALIAAAESGLIGGAGLDVFLHEPADPAPFGRCRNFYLTAHTAAVIPPGARFSAFIDDLAGRDD